MWLTALLNLGSLWCIALLFRVLAEPQLFAAYVYFLLCFLGMAFSTSVAWFRRPPSFALPDIGHDLLPEVLTVYGLDAHMICDKLLYTTIVATLGFVCGHPERETILRRFFVVYGTLMLMRSTTVLMTALPDPYFRCLTMETGTFGHRWSTIPWGRVVSKFITLFDGSASGSLTCGDLIFSGHTIVFVLCALVWHTYYRPSHVWINPMKLVIWALSVVGTVLLLVTRMHWTIDIGLAYYITTTLWNFYHSTCTALHQKQFIKSVVWIDGRLIYPFIAWLETGVSFADFQRNNLENKV